MRNHRALLSGSSQHVLVLDQDVNILEIVRQRLEREGYTVTTSSAQWGIGVAIAVLRPDVVLLDPLMSDSVWQELPGLLGSYPADGDVPIILHSDAAPGTLGAAIDVTRALGILPKTANALTFTFAFNGMLDHRHEPSAAPGRDSATSRAATTRSGSHAISVGGAGSEDLTVQIRVRGTP